MGIEFLALIAMLLVGSNGLTVPPVCWWVLVIWSAIHFGLIWFGYGGDGDV